MRCLFIIVSSASRWWKKIFIEKKKDFFWHFSMYFGAVDYCCLLFSTHIFCCSSWHFYCSSLSFSRLHNDGLLFLHLSTLQFTTFFLLLTLVLRFISYRCCCRRIWKKGSIFSVSFHFSVLFCCCKWKKSFTNWKSMFTL